MWVRGLKPRETIQNVPREVAPYVGAWIETLVLYYHVSHLMVAPYVGAWIETL